MGRHDAYAAFRLDRLDHDRAGLRTDRPIDGGEIADIDLIEALDHRPEAVEIFLLAAGRERRERAAVKRALEGENAKSLGRALR